MRYLFEQLDSSVRDGQHDAILTGQSAWRMGGSGMVLNVLTGAAFALLVTIATLQNENFFQADMPVAGVTASGVHANQHGRIAAFFIAS
jgi:hypothetical protein